MNRSFSLLLAALLFFAPVAYADEQLQLDQQQFVACEYCGMHRIKFGHSRMLIRYKNASPVATCSLHCAAIELALGIDKDPVKIEVADYYSKKLIDAETAFWALGGEKPGVMTTRGKWAFVDKASADKFVTENGGIILDFDHVMKAAYEDMYIDTLMIRKKRKMKRMKMQQKEKSE